MVFGDITGVCKFGEPGTCEPNGKDEATVCWRVVYVTMNGKLKTTTNDEFGVTHYEIDWGFRHPPQISKRCYCWPLEWDPPQSQDPLFNVGLDTNGNPVPRDEVSFKYIKVYDDCYLCETDLCPCEPSWGPKNLVSWDQRRPITHHLFDTGYASNVQNEMDATVDGPGGWVETFLRLNPHLKWMCYPDPAPDVPGA